jgi:vacuolar-type H+-ATPase subunit H
MEKLSKEKREELKLEYKLDNSKSNLKRLIDKYGITERRLFQIVKEDFTEESRKSITESEYNFSKRANEIIKKALDRIEIMIENDDKITLSQLSTTLGILYDKSRLENNLSTSNNAITINIKVEK